jgi:hypothetical protein
VSVLTRLPSTRNSTRATAPPGSLAVAASGTLAPAANCWPAVGLVRLTVGAVLPVPPPLQVVPFSANDVGMPFDPLNVPLNPAVNVALVAMALFQSALLATVTFAPDWVKVTGQPLRTCLAVREGERQRPAVGDRVTGVGDGDVGAESVAPSQALV